MANGPRGTKSGQAWVVSDSSRAAGGPRTLRSRGTTQPNARGRRHRTRGLTFVLPRIGSARFHLRPPFVDGLDVEAPIAANPKSRNFAPLDQAVNGGGMHVQVFRNFLHGHHLALSPEYRPVFTSTVHFRPPNLQRPPLAKRLFPRYREWLRAPQRSAYGALSRQPSCAR